MKSLPIGCAVLTLWGASFTSADDEKSREEVKARLEAFNAAWEARDLDFIRNFYAHDPDMLLFFERRQLRGWSQVETLYQSMFTPEGSTSPRLVELPRLTASELVLRLPTGSKTFRRVE